MRQDGYNGSNVMTTCHCPCNSTAPAANPHPCSWTINSSYGKPVTSGHGCQVNTILAFAAPALMHLGYLQLKTHHANNYHREVVSNMPKKSELVLMVSKIFPAAQGEIRKHLAAGDIQQANEVVQDLIADAVFVLDAIDAEYEKWFEVDEEQEDDADA